MRLGITLIVAASCIASSVITRAATTQPSPADRLILSAEIAVKAAPNDAGSYTKLCVAFMQKARECADGAYYLRAESACQHALAIQPGNYNARRLVAWVYDGEHRFNDGAKAAREAIALNPSDPWNYGTLGDALVELGEYDGAEQAFQTMADLRPDGTAFARIAYMRELLGDMDGAIEMMRKAADAASPREAEHAAWCHVQLGNLLFGSGKPDDAAAEYETALGLFPDHYLALAGLARARSAEQRYDEAIDLYKRSLAVVPMLETAVSFGDLLMFLNRPVEAERQYALVEVIETLSEANRFPPEYQIVGFYADHGRKIDHAIQVGEERAAERRDVRTMDALAWAYYKSGKYTNARRCMTQALRLGSADALFYFHAGMIDARLGDSPQAIGELQKALSLNPYFHPIHAQEARAEIARLGAASAAEEKTP